jgi:hypothetical protein
MKNKVPFFVTTNQFVDKGTPIVNNLFFDIDSYFGLRSPYENVKILLNWCDRHKLQTVVNFSGGKGFHVFVLFKPVIPKNEEQKEKLKAITYTIQMRIAQEIGLQDYDEPTFGRIHMLCRYPTSLYLRQNDENEYEPSGFYCRNLTRAEFDEGLKHIVKLVKEPGTLPVIQPLIHSLKDVMDMFKDFKIIPRASDIDEEYFDKNRAGEIIPTVNALGLPCLMQLVKHSHPPHFERIEVVAFLKVLGYTNSAIEGFIKERNWTRYNPNKTTYQVRTIKPRYVKCGFLRKMYGNLCENCTWRRYGH